MTDDVPALSCRYSRWSFFAFGAVFLILGYGGVGMVSGLIAVQDDQRTQQILIGLGFLALAAGFGSAIGAMIRSAGAPVLTLDRHGFWDRRLTTAPIPWPAIARIEGIEPSLIERLVMPAGRTGTLFIHIRPDWRDRIAFAPTWSIRFQRPFFTKKGRLRVFHKTLDIPYSSLRAALEQAVGAEADRLGPNA